MGKTSDNPKFSQQISELITILDNVKKDYEWNSNEIKRMDALTQDYLHSLELDNLGYKERAKLATKLAECRRERRTHKDMVINLEPLSLFLDSDKGRQMLNLMREALGKTRKIEQYMERRQYHARVAEIGENK